MSPRVGLLGGTFDPLHLGHLAAAEAARVALELDRILLIPSLSPHHRNQPVASAYHRFAMAALAVADRPEYSVSDMELRRLTPSYTSDTLGYLHANGFDPEQLFFIVGTDAFAAIRSWHDYPAILKRCHFVVVQRPGVTHAHLRSLLQDLTRHMTSVRHPSDAGRTLPSILLLAAATPNVSASRIRALLATGESVSAMLPPAVEQHVRKHGLYAHERTALPSHVTRAVTGNAHDHD